MHLDDVIVHKAKVLAARRATSLSKLVAGEIERLVAEDDTYQLAHQTAIDHLDRGFHLGNSGIRDRSQLHER